MHMTLTPTERTRLRRRPTRGSFETEAIYAILDEGFVCHIAFAVDGQPYAIPTGYARSGDQIYIHGSTASRMLRTLGDGIDLCLTVTLVDGLVLARSAFHHSMNYRSVVVLGKARTVTDDGEKVEALRCFTDHIVPGRWPELRPVTGNELRATTVLALPIQEASAKVRSGPPIDAEEDYGWPIWAGVVPLHVRAGEPVPDDRVGPEVPEQVVPRRLAKVADRKQKEQSPD
jgi:nitroimidazol reductase NimA-like FMN-containing flavoprotein (pyridoxamine 5'-phosphate oxidase superfamily)